MEVLASPFVPFFAPLLTHVSVGDRAEVDIQRTSSLVTAPGTQPLQPCSLLSPPHGHLVIS